MGHGLHNANGMNHWIGTFPKSLRRVNGCIGKTPPVLLKSCFLGSSATWIKIGDFQVLVVCLSACVFWYVNTWWLPTRPVVQNMAQIISCNLILNPWNEWGVFLYTPLQKNVLCFPCLQGMLSRESQPIRQSKTLVFRRDRPQHCHNGRPVQYILGSKRWGMVGSLGNVVFCPKIKELAGGHLVGKQFHLSLFVTKKKLTQHKAGTSKSSNLFSRNLKYFLKHAHTHTHRQTDDRYIDLSGKGGILERYHVGLFKPF